MTRRHGGWLLASLLLLSACGPSGVISGRVNVEGGGAGNLTVFFFGPQSGAGVTRDDGTFSLTGLPDGAYVLRATVRGAEVEEQSVATVVTNGAASPEPQLTFRVANAKLSGRVVFADGSDAANVSVTAVGEQTRATVTVSGGAFSLEGLKSGAYLVTAEARDTREGRVSVGAAAAGATEVGELRLTPVGRLQGLVTESGMPVAGVQVTVPGTSVSALTDAAGAFELTMVPTGAQTLLARVGSSPFVKSATQMVTVVRGENPALLVALTAEPPRTGTVTGVVTFRGNRSPRDIVVSVEGAGVTATPQLNGAYSLAVPVGAWDIVASAPMHPKMVLGRVLVTEGQSVALPGAELSWYRPVWRSNGQVTTVVGLPSIDAHPWALVLFREPEVRLALLNVQTFEFRILAVGVNFASEARISSRGKYAAWFINSTTFLYEVATGQVTAFPTPMTAAATPLVQRAEFSTDESVLFVQRSNRTLTRIPLASPASAVTFPAAGSAVAIDAQSFDRWFVREGSEARLVTPTTDVAQIFTNISQFSLTPTAWALTDCVGGLTCTLRVVGPTATAAVAVAGVSPNVGGISAFTGGNLESRGDYPCFNAGGSAFCARATDGTRYPLPAVPSQFKLNAAGDRVIMVFPGGSGTAVREEAMPPSSGTSSAASSTFGYSAHWVSPTRGIAYETGGTPRALLDFKAGVLSTDNDLGTQGVTVTGPLVVYPKASTTRWQAFLGDKPTRAVPVATTRPVTMSSARFFGGTETVTDYGTVSFDTTTSYVIDERAMTVRNLALGRGTQGLRSGAVELAIFDRSPGGDAFALVHGQNVAIEVLDGTATPTAFVGSQALAAGYLAQGTDGRTISLGTFAP